MPHCRALQAVAVLFAAAISAAQAGAEPLRLVAEAQLTMPPVERFVAADVFKVGARIGERTVWFIGQEFAAQVLPVVETDVRAVPVKGWTLGYAAHDAALIKSLGGEANAALPLSAIYYVMTLGEQGGNRVDWRSNFAYVRVPGEDRLRAVHWFVNKDGEWVIGSEPVRDPAIDRPQGSRMFGRAPGVTSEQIKLGGLMKR
jgi:hypothetical protein